MAKPICVIYYLPEINGNPIQVKDMNDSMRKFLPDYHVLCIPSWKAMDGSAETLELKVYYEKDFTKIQYAELKEIILNHLHDNTQNTIT